jgi:signal transduction histidine kinase
VIRALKDWAKRHWPRLKLRTILIGTLLFAAVLPGIGAIFLRVYENVLVRQTEAELVAQGAALAATAAAIWPGALPDAPEPAAAFTGAVENDDPYGPVPARAPTPVDGRYRPEPPTIDLRSTPILPERPRALRAAAAPDPAAAEVAIRLAPILAKTARTTLAAIQFTDARGRVLIGYGQGGSYALVPEVAAALAGRTGTVLRRNGDYRPRYSFEWLSKASALRIHHVRPVIVNGRVAGVLMFSRSPRALFKGLYQDLDKILLGIVLIFSLLTVIAILLSRGIGKPIRQLSAATRAVAAGHGAIPPVPPTAAIEIQALFADFAVMAEAIARRSRYLRDFAASVSHEFKTPLAGISGAIELLQDHHDGMSEAERTRFLANIAADAGRLSQLVTRLLDLARADVAQPDPDARCDVALAVARVVDAWAGRDFAIAMTAAPGLPMAAVPASTIEAAMAALIENSRQAGAGAVTIAIDADAERVRIVVADDGPGVPVADQTRLFEPFFTSRRAEGGTGLGLPIVRSLLGASGGEIGLVEGERGAVFAVRVPRG